MIWIGNMSLHYNRTALNTVAQIQCSQPRKCNVHETWSKFLKLDFYIKLFWNFCLASETMSALVDLREQTSLKKGRCWDSKWEWWDAHICIISDRPEDEEDNLNPTDDGESSEESHGASNETQLSLGLDLLVSLNVVKGRRVKVDLHKLKSWMDFFPWKIVTWMWMKRADWNWPNAALLNAELSLKCWTKLLLKFLYSERSLWNFILSTSSSVLLALVSCIFFSKSFVIFLYNSLYNFSSDLLLNWISRCSSSGSSSISLSILSTSA